MNAIVYEANIVFQELQGMATLISQQRVRLKELVDTYTLMSQMEGPLREEQLQNTDPFVSSTKGSFRVTHAHVRSYMDDLGRWVLMTMDAMEESPRNHLVSCIGTVFVHLADGIFSIVAERDSSNDVGEELPAVLPHHLVASDMRTLVRQLDVHNPCLKRCFSNEKIQMIDNNYAEFIRAIRMEPELKAALNAMTNTAISFEDAWSVVGSRFCMLKEFCGGLATVFPNTATVESDFSRLGFFRRLRRAPNLRRPALYTSSSARARVGSLLSDPFPVQRGVRQGCPLSGLLFNLFINDILDGVAPITVPGLPQDTNPIRGLMYADDVAVFADSEKSLLAASTAIEKWANQWEMQFGVAKCGIISFTGHLAPRLDNPLDIRLHGQLVSRVESYKYLGVLIDSKLDHSAWLKQKRLSLEHTISALHPVLANHQLTVNYRSRIFSAVVMGKAYYGLELVGGNKSHLAPLQTTINKGIRLFTGCSTLDCH
ncbi:hypothetical protein BASA50_001347 [Batrachochytrium salamandrivorans]|uniref:Reverse transcriptase domain-containing protein n=1 Tax=Batrachochytrium salamandrivorans TaxID=1357716 RepID=A0ABQ8EVC3_9FUNG|nr:hypothetical protein BASA50_001347 [Batrachochytrium salamandrivorans]